MFMLSAHVNPIYSLKIVENIANLFIILEHSFQFFIKDFNSTKDSTFLKAVGIEFHVKGPKYLMEF